jgi:hypothetical protein
VNVLLLFVLSSNCRTYLHVIIVMFTSIQLLPGQVPDQMVVIPGRSPLTIETYDVHKQVDAAILASGVGTHVSSLHIDSADSRKDRPWTSTSGTLRTRTSDVNTGGLYIPKGMTNVPGARATPSERLAFLEYQLESLPDGWLLLRRFELSRGYNSRRKGGVCRSPPRGRPFSLCYRSE